MRWKGVQEKSVIRESQMLAVRRWTTCRASKFGRTSLGIASRQDSDNGVHLLVEGTSRDSSLGTRALAIAASVAE